MRVREATVADVAAIAELEREVFGAEAYPAFFLRQAYDLWGELLWVAEAEGGGVVGYALAAAAVRAGEACLLAAAVRPGQRGRGIASELLQALLERLAASGFRTVWLTVHPENTGAIRLYRRLGFRESGEEGSYFGPGEPRLRMDRSLAPTLP